MPKGDKSVTIKDIAALCGVSVSTVSNVLNDKTNKVSRDVAAKVHEVIAQTGYKPNYLAKGLRATQTKTLGIIAEDLIIFSTSPIIEGVMQSCEDAGYSVVIENMRLFGRWEGGWMHDENRFQSVLSAVMDKMNGLNVDGIIYIGSYEHVVNIDKSSTSLPIIMVYARPSDNSIPCFVLDDEAGGCMAYEYLLNKGHKRIGVITGEADNIHTVHRLRGINRAMFNAGLLYDPSLIEHRSWNKQGGYEGIKNLIKQNITAVFCMSDQIASGVYEYLAEEGLKPGEDLSIMGYDNHELTTFLSPELTTVALPLEKLGKETANRMLKAVDKNLTITGTESAVESEPNVWCICGDVVERLSIRQLDN